MTTLGIVGCAHCHTPWILSVLKARTDVSFKAVYDHDTARAAKSAQVLGCKTVTDPNLIWSDPSIDAVFVMSETNRHEQDVFAAARAKKPVFVEKPLGLGTKDAASMAKALEEAGVGFMTGYRTRSEGIFQFLRDQIKSGGFGHVNSIRYITCHGGMLKQGFQPEHSWMADVAQAGGGGFLDLGTHALDAVLWLGGKRVLRATSAMQRLSFSPRGADCEDFGEGLLEFEGGTIGTMAGSWADFHQPVRCVISGTEAHAHVTAGKLYFKSKNIAGADGVEPWTDVPPDLPVVFDVFVDWVKSGGPNPFITASEAANVCSVHQAMFESARTGSWVTPTWI